MIRILHISDTHFGTERHAVVEALLRHVREQPTDLLVLSGDITQRAKPGQFTAAKRFVDRVQALGVPRRLVIPGNHDLPLYNLAKRFLCPYRDYSRAFGEDLEPVFENDEVLMIGLNTTNPRRRKDGAVTAAQVAAVVERLRRCDPGKVRVVVAHQPFGSMVASDDRNLQHGAEEALAHWAEAGLDIVMGGHIHLPYVLPLSLQYRLKRDVWIVQAGTALSSRLRGNAPNSFNRIIITRDPQKQVRVERWDYQEQLEVFLLGSHFDLQ
ncbi:metallophosphoesterase family protein [Pseudomonas veronii]